MSDTTYNGWTNYATWRVNLELFDGIDPRDWGYGTANVVDLREWLQQYAEEIIEQTSSEGLARDYALSFLSDVNWWEIANHIVDAHADAAEEADHA